MPRNSKPKHSSNTNFDTGIRPSDLNVPVDEQKRLIKESEILQKLDAHSEDTDEDEALTIADHIFNAIVLIIPCASLFIMMDLLAHRQYSQPATFKGEFGRLAETLPFLSIFIYYTTKNKTSRLCQLALLITSLFSGTRMVYLINRGSFLKVMRQTPPLGALWVYAIWQLDLVPAVISLVAVYGWVKWKGLKIIF